MARPSKLLAALPQVHAYFDKLPSKIVSAQEMIEIFENNKDAWQLAKSMRWDQFFEALLKHANFGNIELDFNRFRAHFFFYKDTSINAIASNISKTTYLSHYTSLALHGLTDQVPKVIYVTRELGPKHSKYSGMTQDAIDNAFKKEQRETTNIADTIIDFKIALLEGKYSDNLGVITDFDQYSEEKIRFTDIERTLIDITVRPNYAGGVYEVLKAYKNAKDKLSVNRLSAMLKKLNYIYPYHQAIGFYLEKSGVYSQSQLNLLKREAMNYKFYLTYNMKDIEYSKEWHIYYPKGM